MQAQDCFKTWFERLLESENTEQTIPLQSPSPAAQAFCAIAAHQHQKGSVLWVVENDTAMLQGIRDLHALQPAGDTNYLTFPVVYEDKRAGQHVDIDGGGARRKTLHRLQTLARTQQNAIIITPIEALLQPTLSPYDLQNGSREVNLNEYMSLQEVRVFLENNGYDLEGEVLEKGQYAARGGILDVWTAESEFPFRLEWFGDEVESIRFFDPITQRTVEKTDSVMLAPIGETATANATLLDHITSLFAILWFDHDTICEHVENKTIANEGIIPNVCIQKPAEILYLDANALQANTQITQFASLEHAVRLPATGGTKQLEDARRIFLEDLMRYHRKGWHISIYFDTTGTRDHFIHHVMPDAGKTLQIEIGALSEGFRCPTIHRIIVAESDLYGRKRFPTQNDTIAKKAKRYAGSRINDFTDMEPGDLVVHTDHGVGRYIGVQKITFNGKNEEVLAIEYAEEAKLYVPVTHAHLLSRYVGMANASTRLHRLGGKRWIREKNAAGTAVMDLAAELLEIQARRNLLQGHAFAADGPLQHEFDHAFPFVETQDQMQVIAEVKADMEAARPMDRLICGDAGYGKTEVAMRAAFKAVSDGMQVAVLVPTTVLAQQHFQTFSERMSGFDIRIAVISRFQTTAQRKKTIQALQDGQIDIIIGTHALVQPGIKFSNLGLVIIDEEQRFGVAHKERLKSLRALVDVLTLSATPIPRTLYMSMTGARDLSLLRTAPRERVPIETTVATATDETIAQAIRYEHQRGGQVYLLHNRVVSIGKRRETLTALLPEVKIEVAHGQLHSSELSAVMQRFVDGRIDVLLCTTIIESGVDIPRANTIIIDRADRFGIADLYQLRGRVGRGNRKGYAYLLLPRHGIVDKAARERIQAIRRHTGLGAGFNLAIKDMEIRGAGNILGSAQSGHISAIGFGLYCQLLQRAVARMQGQPVPELSTEMRLDFVVTSETEVPAGCISACIPTGYIPDERVRIAIYRRIAEANAHDAIDDLKNEISDRFGNIPRAVKRLISIAHIRCTAAHYRITAVETRGKRIFFFRRDKPLSDSNHSLPRLQATDPDQKLQELQEKLQQQVENA